MDRKLAALAEEVEASFTLEPGIAERVLSALNGLAGDLTIDCQDLDSTDRVLSVIYAVKPNWSLSIRGSATLPNGHWRCTLRKSSARDDDAYLGIGRGPTLPHSLLAAFLKALSVSR
jgi:hypothetical protein